MNPKLDKMPRQQLLQLAMWLTHANVEVFDPYTDEQLRLLITSKSIEYVIGQVEQVKLKPNMRPHIKSISDDGEQVEVITKCMSCKELTTIKVPRDQFFDWQGGKLIQLAMPQLSSYQRELLISGTCPSCCEKMFGSSK